MGRETEVCGGDGELTGQQENEAVVGPRAGKYSYTPDKDPETPLTPGYPVAVFSVAPVRASNIVVYAPAGWNPDRSGCGLLAEDIVAAPFADDHVVSLASPRALSAVRPSNLVDATNAYSRDTAGGVLLTSDL